MVSGYLWIYTNFQMCYFKCHGKTSLVTEKWDKLLSATLEEIVGKWSSKIKSFTLSLIFLPSGTTTENRSPQHCSQSPSPLCHFKASEEYLKENSGK